MDKGIMKNWFPPQAEIENAVKIPIISRWFNLKSKLPREKILY